MKKVIQAILGILLTQACSVEDNKLAQVLEIAGKNKSELEKVLNYYSLPGDSLKYKAAVFLIKNLPYHSFIISKHANAYDSICDSILVLDQSLLLTNDSLTNRAIRKENFERVWGGYFSNTGEIENDGFETKHDIQEVKADYLIDNIEYAFMAWENPWSKGYTFDEFCKYILPYRIGSEPLDAWRPYMYEELKWVRDSLKNINDPIKVCGFVNKWIQNTIYDERIVQVAPGGIKVLNLFKGKIWSSCYDQTALGISILRTLGIAAAASTIPHWGIRSGSHEFNAVLDAAGKWHSFSTGYLNPEEFYLDSRAPKVYLTKFFTELDSVDAKLYQERTTQDITSNLLPVINIAVDVSDSLMNSEVFLCVFDKKSWVPLTKGKRVGNHIAFMNMGREMAYLPAVIRNGQVSPVGNPIMVNMAGSIKYIQPQEKKISYKFDRKYPILFPRVYDPRCKDMIGGRFQISDNIDFKNATDIFTIKDQPGLQVESVKISPRKAKYVRYVFPTVNYAFKSGPAYLGFYDSEFKKIEGTYISSEGVTTENIKQIFDEDLLSHVKVVQYERAINFQRSDVIANKASKDSLWVGMKLNGDVSIADIKYCARNDKNGIYGGMRYELLYWKNDNWLSLGIKYANDANVSFNNIPSGALLWLRNLDEGEDERIFVIDKGQIIWM
ncbi:hypothetical protein MUK70_19110 [Dyadobacter chenwenxiniae]|uniref:Peptide-N(4)-(N-acetyl-beta-glucosaminyl)asparagine amidase n=1 Tax=Dyadobacter chenwenxiniae TaxID=2906456 RepID=A0A9X1PIK0_9BACT|nr:hypothetical protein [Dyadobacter chenwenxiniae]MCF0061351.1 hypothetical protein [Dyadobacter chenwenxiniae]UON81173.1 hypothetical protein MUK70_19110 [Dyadobacter chenwenxiniae]